MGEDSIFFTLPDEYSAPDLRFQLDRRLRAGEEHPLRRTVSLLTSGTKRGLVI
ncbi:MAG: hypothetical protein AB7S61_11405 [Methanoregulaceae archaeon]